MLKKILAAILIVSLTQVYANQVTTERKALETELASSLDELNFKLNVEWNQVDGSFYNETMSTFETQVAKLQEKGLTNEDLVNFTKDRIKDKNAQAEVKKIASIIATNNMSSEEARAFALNKLNNAYARGASWTGGKVGLKLAVLLAAIVIITVVVKKTHDNNDPTPTNDPTPSYSPSPSYDPCYYTEECQMPQ